MKHLKHILVICLLFAGTYSAKAQTPPDSTSGLKEIIDRTFAPLESSPYPITTGLLMEKGMMDSSFF